MPCEIIHNSKEFAFLPPFSRREFPTLRNIPDRIAPQT